MNCRYCLLDDNEIEMIDPCDCQGSMKYVHKNCLLNWIKQSNKKFEKVHIFSDDSFRSFECEICKYKIKCHLVYQNSFIYSFLNTIKLTFLDYKNIPYLMIQLFIIYPL
jgi:E3 ubiquitin-protein ligase MARCH6